MGAARGPAPLASETIGAPCAAPFAGRLAASERQFSAATRHSAPQGAVTAGHKSVAGINPGQIRIAKLMLPRAGAMVTPKHCRRDQRIDDSGGRNALVRKQLPGSGFSSARPTRSPNPPMCAAPSPNVLGASCQPDAGHQSAVKANRPESRSVITAQGDNPSIRTNVFACLELAHQSLGKFTSRLVAELLSRLLRSSKAALHFCAAPAV